MNQNEHAELRKMHEQILQSGVSAFDSAYLEHYTKLFVKSLEGKGDLCQFKLSDLRSQHPVV